jgi:hypothetical protein
MLLGERRRTARFTLVAVERGTDRLGDLPARVRAAARIDTNGEVSWPLARVEEAIEALADTGYLILGLDVRTYAEGGAVTEVPLVDLSGGATGPEEARDQALAALANRGGDARAWVLVTWQ